VDRICSLSTLPFSAPHGERVSEAMVRGATWGSHWFPSSERPLLCACPHWPSVPAPPSQSPIQIATVQALLAAKASPDANTTETGERPLHTLARMAGACRGGCGGGGGGACCPADPGVLRLARLLVAAGARVDALPLPVLPQDTPLSRLVRGVEDPEVCCQPGLLAFASFLLASGADPAAGGARSAVAAAKESAHAGGCSAL
jgi:hypothetical protein